LAGREFSPSASENLAELSRTKLYLSAFIQYSTIKSICNVHKVENRIWGAGSRWAGGGVGVGYADRCTVRV